MGLTGRKLVGSCFCLSAACEDMSFLHLHVTRGNGAWRVAFSHLLGLWIHVFLLLMAHGRERDDIKNCYLPWAALLGCVFSG